MNHAHQRQKTQIIIHSVDPLGQPLLSSKKIHELSKLVFIMNYF